MMNRRLDREKEKIGSAKVDQLAAEIENRNRQLVEDCTNTKIEAANFQLTPETKKNQTCVMTTKDQTLMIQVINSCSSLIVDKITFETHYGSNNRVIFEFHTT